MFGRRFKPQQFDYEPIYYDKEADERRQRAEASGNSDLLKNEQQSRIHFRRPPQLRKGLSRYTLFGLILLLGLLAYVFLWVNQFSTSDLPVLTPNESVQ